MTRKTLFSEINWKSWMKRIYGFVVLVLCLSCIVIRAHYSAITLDEAHTYISYVERIRPGYMEEFWANYDGRANNHLLNTVLMYLVERIVGIHYDEFLVRFPAVCFGIGFGVFCLYIYRKKEISTLVFSLLMLNAFVNVSFSMARGYGMATCLTMVACYFIKCYADSDYTEHKFLSLSVLFFTLAETANTVVLLITASAAVLLFIIMFKKKILISYLKGSWLFLLPMAIGNFLLLAYHIYISADGEGKALAVYSENPIDGIISCFVGMYTERFVGTGTLLLIILFIVAALFGMVRKKKLFFVYLFILYFAICSATSVMFGKGLPTDRFLYPTCPLIIFAIGEALALFWNSMIKVICNKWSRPLWSAVSVIFSALFLLHFIKETDFTINNDLRTHLHDSVMGAYHNSLDSEELHYLHIPFYQKQFLYRYGYDIYLKKYTIEAMSLAETLQMLQNEKFNALIEINNRAVLDEYQYEFKKLGINIKHLPERTDFILLNRGAKERMEYIYDFKDSDNTQETILGTMSLFYGENGSYGIYVNGNECLAVWPEELSPDISICVWHNGEDEPFDYKLFAENK